MYRPVGVTTKKYDEIEIRRRSTKNLTQEEFSSAGRERNSVDRPAPKMRDVYHLLLQIQRWIVTVQHVKHKQLVAIAQHGQTRIGTRCRWEWARLEFMQSHISHVLSDYLRTNANWLTKFNVLPLNTNALSSSWLTIIRLLSALHAQYCGSPYSGANVNVRSSAYWPRAALFCSGCPVAGLFNLTMKSDRTRPR